MFAQVFQYFPIISNCCLGFLNFPMFWRSLGTGGPFWLKTFKLLENWETLNKNWNIFEILGKHRKTKATVGQVINTFQCLLRYSNVFQLVSLFCLGFANFPIFWRSWGAGGPFWLKTSKILESWKTLNTH